MTDTDRETETPVASSRLTRFQVLLVSAIVLVGTLIAAAIWFTSDTDGQAATTSAIAQAPASQGVGTCAAWMDVEKAFQNAPMLPGNWRKDFSPETNAVVEARIAAIRGPLDRFAESIVPNQGLLATTAQRVLRSYDDLESTLRGRISTPMDEVVSQRDTTRQLYDLCGIPWR